MSGDPCAQVVERLDRFEADGLAADERHLVEEHLRQCSTCRAEIRLRRSLAGARALAERDMSPARRELLFGRIRNQVAGPERSVGRLPRRGLRRAGIATAVAVAGVSAAIVLIARTQRSAPDSAAGWLTEERGVYAWLQPRARASVSWNGAQTVIDLERGTVLVHFDKTRADGPLLVRTESAEVRVRGTVFYVDAASPATTYVGVRRGRVEVRAGEQQASVGAREAARFEANSLAKVRPDRAQIEALEELFPDQLDGAPSSLPRADAPAEAAPEAPVEVAAEAGTDGARPGAEPDDRSHAAAPVHSSTRRPPGTRDEGSTRAGDRPATSPESSPSTDAQGGSSSLVRAQELVRDGHNEQAAEILRRELAADRLTTSEREEAYYLLATVLRAQRKYREAASTLKKLSESSSSRRARLAVLERARILAHTLGQLVEAQRLMDQFVRTGGDDALAREAWIESCVIRVERGAREDALDCLQRLLKRFPDQAKRAEVRELRQRLVELRE